jgi:FKBP-type peptidyl-prolyl cis-trans isomerase 2/predicted Fe-Mo cluster-binding NifX family protein
MGFKVRKRIEIMKIAVTYDNGNVFQHFGKARNFKIYEADNNEIVSSEVIDCGDTGHEALAGILADRGVDAVVCGGLGEGAMEALSAAGIEVCSGAQGDADAAVQAYLNGELSDQGVNCDHHGHDHHEDGSNICHNEEADDSGMDMAESGLNVEEACGSGCGGCGDAESSCGGCGDSDSSCGSGCGGCGGGCGGCGGHMQVILDGKNAGKRCSVHYRGTLDDGTQFDSSFDRGQPLEFICGTGMMISGFDKAVVDMEVGSSVDVHLNPEEAYGMPDPNAVITSLISELPGCEEMSVGDRAYLQDEYGRSFPVRVTEKTDEKIVMDANHELAGKALNFHIELLSAE